MMKPLPPPPSCILPLIVYLGTIYFLPEFTPYLCVTSAGHRLPAVTRYLFRCAYVGGFGVRELWPSVVIVFPLIIMGCLAGGCVLYARPACHMYAAYVYNPLKKFLNQVISDFKILMMIYFNFMINVWLSIAIWVTIFHKIFKLPESRIYDLWKIKKRILFKENRKSSWYYQSKF